MAILEANDEGGLYLPPEVIGETKPHMRFRLEKAGETLVLVPIGEESPFWQQATPEEWVRSFREWADAPRPVAKEIPIDALRRENLYE